MISPIPTLPTRFFATSTSLSPLTSTSLVISRILMLAVVDFNLLVPLPMMVMVAPMMMMMIAETLVRLTTTLLPPVLPSQVVTSSMLSLAATSMPSSMRLRHSLSALTILLLLTSSITITGLLAQRLVWDCTAPQMPLLSAPILRLVLTGKELLIMLRQPFLMDRTPTSQPLSGTTQLVCPRTVTFLWDLTRTQMVNLGNVLTAMSAMEPPL